ncbi:MAG: glycosyltransferase [Thermodesulfobacteriota bacterium]
MKVVYAVATSLGGGGLGKDAYEAVKGLYQNDYLKKVVVYGNKQKTIPKNYIRNIRVHPAKVFSNLPARYYYPVKRKYLDWETKCILKKGADVFHGWSSGSLSSLKFCKDNRVVSFLENPGPHCLYAEAIVSQEYDKLGIKRKNEPEILKGFFGQDKNYHLSEYDKASYIIVESEFTYKTFLMYGIPEEKLVFVPRGVDTETFVPLHAKEDNGVFRVLFVGSICVRKGIRYLLDAWSKLNLKNAELVLVGHVRSDVRPFLERYTASYNNIKVVGFTNDPVRLYQDASVFVFPSLSEGSAKVTYEAMACGLPVIVTPNAGSVAKNREHGFVVPVQNEEILSEKILYLYQHPKIREEMGLRARQHIESYKWDRYRKTLIGTYEKAYNKENFKDCTL